ncbi:alpha-aspartyl dipeptidase-like [Varroa destructor]|uniref:Dipeptidase E n=1 Tax=Varroa destructor TaxID=109461 RepID=A0A7M7KRD8_VARDE|nr:alpha-aspartyl dipeptidase-like [Varroa destructor]
MKIIFGFNEVGMNRKLLLLSNSTTYGTSYLSYAKDMIKAFLGKHEVSEILFVPYARCDYEDYTTTVREAVEPMGFSVKGIHTFPSPVEAVNKAQCIFIGGGNTFLLLKTLYENQLVEPIRKRVLEGNLVYIGSSAGTNVSTPSINTTNDMPIVYPPTFEALNLVCTSMDTISHNLLRVKLYVIYIYIYMIPSFVMCRVCRPPIAVGPLSRLACSRGVI